MLFDLFIEHPKITKVRRVLSGHFWSFPAEKAEDQVDSKALNLCFSTALSRSEIGIALLWKPIPGVGGGMEIPIWKEWAVGKEKARISKIQCWDNHFYSFKKGRD